MGDPAQNLKTFSDTYQLSRGGLETLRLSCHHYCNKRRQGWLIHPQISQYISQLENPQIADVACGTGIWGLEAADTFAHATITGLDISDAQYPPSWSLPSNARLGILNLAEPVTPEHQGKYDLVHCRLLLQAGPNIDPRIWVKTFESLLKPGGWLQWEEPGLPTFCRLSQVDCSVTPLPLPALNKILNLIPKAGWFPDFVPWMKQNSSLQDLDKMNVPPNLSVAKLENDVIRKVSDDMLSYVLRIKDLDESIKEELRGELVDKWEGINRDGDLLSFNWMVGLGRKPVGRVNGEVVVETGS